MENIRLPEELLPRNLKKPAAFIVKKDPELPDYGLHTGDLVIVEQECEFTDGELSVFLNDQTNDPHYQMSDKRIGGYVKYWGKVVLTVNYSKTSPFVEMCE